MDHYIIISAPDCEWCRKAKDLLWVRGITYSEFDTTEPNIRHLFFMLGVKTVPQIFKAATGNHPVEYIGGYEDLERHILINNP